MPDQVVLFKDEELNLGQVFGIVLKEEEQETLETSSNSNKVENKTVTVSLFNIIDLKKVQISTVENVKVIPLGNTIGIKLYSNGVLVIGMTEIEGHKPYENTGIKEGDLIVEVDNVDVTTTAKLIECVNNSEGETVEITYLRDGLEYTVNMEPVKTKDNNWFYKLFKQLSKENNEIEDLDLYYLSNLLLHYIKLYIYYIYQYQIFSSQQTPHT